MNKKVIIAITIGLFLMTLSLYFICRNTQMFKGWSDMDDNVLSKEKSFDDVLYRAVIDTNPNLSDDLIYFNFSIESRKNFDFSDDLQKGLNSYDDFIAYLSFDMQNDFKLLCGEDTLMSVLYHFERTYGVTPYRKILMAFEKCRLDDNNIKLVFNDKLYNYGIINFSFASEMIKQKNI